MNLFSILAISEHCLHEEQLVSLKLLQVSLTIIQLSVPMIIPLCFQGNLHTGSCFNSPLKNISSNCIVGIRCDFPYSTPLFILSVYLPSACHNITEFNEYFDHLWALYDSLYVIVMGDFNGDLDNSLGDKAKHEPNQRGLKLLDFANYFNLCPVNLMRTCHGPNETYFSHCGRYRSTLDYIFYLTLCLKKSFQQKHFVVRG